MRILSFFILSLLVVGCSVSSTTEEEPIARVYESYLYAKDIEGLVAPNTSEEDSLSLVKVYIENWARKELILEMARLNIPEIETKIQKEVEEYKSARVIYAYETEYVRQQLDTTVKSSEIEEYYSANKKNFELKDYIVKAYYIRLTANAPDIRKAKKWFQLKKDDDFLLLEEYCHKYAAKFILDDEKWYYLSDLKKEISLEELEEKQYFNTKDDQIFENEDYLHMLKIIDYKMKDSISPLSMEEQKIKNIIINQRKLDILKNMRTDIYQDALNRNKFEIYNTK